MKNGIYKIEMHVIKDRERKKYQRQEWQKSLANMTVFDLDAWIKAI